MGEITDAATILDRGQTIVSVSPRGPRCQFSECVGEIVTIVRHELLTVHLAEANRRALIVALGGSW